MQELKTVSIIIPAYNVEKYIGRCLDSILAQTLQDFEVIVIDDYSCDNTRNVVLSYVQRDNRVRLICQGENKGPMMARMYGIQSAIGKYVMFVDGDDTLPINAVEGLVGAMEREKVDLVVGNVACLSWNGQFLHLMTNTLPFGYDSRGVYHALLEKKMIHALWGKMYKIDLFKQRLLSLKNYNNGEDAIMFYQLVSGCRTVQCVDVLAYEYYMTEGSSSRRRLSDGQIRNIVESWSYIEKYIEPYPDLMLLFKRNRVSSLLNLLKSGYDKKVVMQYVSPELKECLNLKTLSALYSGKEWVYNVLAYYSKSFRYILKLKHCI